MLLKSLHSSPKMISGTAPSSLMLWGRGLGRWGLKTYPCEGAGGKVSRRLTNRIQREFLFNNCIQSYSVVPASSPPRQKTNLYKRNSLVGTASMPFSKLKGSTCRGAPMCAPVVCGRRNSIHLVPIIKLKSIMPSVGLGVGFARSRQRRPMSL